MEQINIDLSNFSLDRENEKRILSRLDVLRDIAPAYASLYLTMRENESSYTGELQINSLDKKFIARSNNRTIESLFIELESSIKKQIMDWKKKRILGKYISPEYFSKVGKEAFA